MSKHTLESPPARGGSKLPVTCSVKHTITHSVSDYRYPNIARTQHPFHPSHERIGLPVLRSRRRGSQLFLKQSCGRVVQLQIQVVGFLETRLADWCNSVGFSSSLTIPEGKAHVYK